MTNASATADLTEEHGLTAEITTSLQLLEDEIRNTLVVNEGLIDLAKEYHNYEEFCAHLAKEIVTEWVNNVRGDG